MNSVAAAPTPIALPAGVVVPGNTTSFWHDVRIRHGIKVGLAANIALLLAEWLHLEHPNWSVLAVLVLANTHYVGDTTSRAAMRSIGTIVGATSAVWIVGDFANTPAIFVLCVFVVVAFAAYKSGQIGKTASPYAYYLMGLSLVSVATFSIDDPGNVWRAALARSVETLLGVLCATFIYALLWPRDALAEFLSEASNAMRTVRALLPSHAEAGREENLTAVPSETELRSTLARQMGRLRMILTAGARGNAQFRMHMEACQQLVISLVRLAHVSIHLRAHPGGASESSAEILRGHDELIAAVRHDLECLGRVAWFRGSRLPSAFDPAFSAFETEVKDQWRRASTPLSYRNTETVFGRLAAWRVVRDELDRFRAMAAGLPTGTPSQPPRPWWKTEWTKVDKLYVLIGLKTGLAVCVAFLLLEWVHPPGSTVVPLAAMNFSLLGRAWLSLGGRGDLRVLQRVFFALCIGLPIIAALWLVMPFLANYWAMGVLLFFFCAWFGYCVAIRPGFTFPLLFLVLAINIGVALNPQQPVRFETLLDNYLGLMIGAALGTVVARFFWPLLPQKLVQQNLIRYFEELRVTLAHVDNGSAAALTVTMALSAEALQAVGHMPFLGCPSDERAKLAEFVRTAQPLALEFATLRETKERFTDAGLPEALREPLQALESNLDQFLSLFADGFRKPDARARSFPDLDGYWVGLEAAFGRHHPNG